MYILAYVSIADEELRAQILFGNDFMVCERDGAYACEDQVLGDLVGKSLDGDEEDVGRADPGAVNGCCIVTASERLLLLGLHAP